MSSLVPAVKAVGEALKAVAGLPVFIAGSSVACLVHEDVVGSNAFDDVDVFCASQNSLIATVQLLLSQGYTIEPRHQRVWARWLEFGFNKWHTNSLKLSKGGIEINCVYKLVDGHPTTSLSQVLESFDFGLLGVGIDARDGVLRDLRPFLFPNLNKSGPLPLLPVRQTNWRNGFISQYQGLREVGRYVKYVDYGYDLSLVKDDLLTGYKSVASYMIDRGGDEKLKLGAIYESLAMRIEDDDLDALREAAKEILFLDDLDAIMEAID